MNAETDRAAPDQGRPHTGESCHCCMSFNTVRVDDALVCNSCGTWTREDDTDYAALDALDENAKVAYLKKWCEDRYTKGADVMVECWSNDDYLDLIDPKEGEDGTMKSALSLLQSLADVYHDREADARHYQEGWL